MPNEPQATIFPHMTTPVLHEPSALALTVNGETRAVAPGTALAGMLGS